MMPLGAPSISKYGSLVRLDAQIVALRLRRPLSTIYITFCLFTRFGLIYVSTGVETPLVGCPLLFR